MHLGTYSLCGKITSQNPVLAMQLPPNSNEAQPFPFVYFSPYKIPFISRFCFCYITNKDHF